MRYVSLALLSVATVALGASTASAQYFYRPPVVYDGPSYSPYYGAPARAFYCVKDCTQDTSPCDPPEFKRTDGRCSNPAPGVR
jgi:hypothetical protein